MTDLFLQVFLNLTVMLQYFSTTRVGHNYTSSLFLVTLQIKLPTSYSLRSSNLFPLLLLRMDFFLLT